MKISTKGRYGVRMMTELAERYGQGPVLVETIAKNQGISGKYIHVLVGGLKTAGLLRAVRGPSGGYELTRHPSSITALDVVAALEGELWPTECVGHPASCERAESCAARGLWCEVASAISAVLSSKNLEELARAQRMSRTVSPDYCI